MGPFLLYSVAAQGGHPSGCQHRALLTLLCLLPGHRPQGSKGSLLKARGPPRLMPGPFWGKYPRRSHGSPWPQRLPLNRASPQSLRSWQAPLPVLQWLSGTPGGVAHGWECAWSTLGGGRGSDSSRSAPSQARPGPASTGPFWVRDPRSIPPLTRGSRPQARPRGQARTAPHGLRARSPTPSRPRSPALPQAPTPLRCLSPGRRLARLQALQRGPGHARAGGRFLSGKRAFWVRRGALPFSPGSGSRSRFLPSRCFLPRPRPLLLDSDILPRVPGGGTHARRGSRGGLRSRPARGAPAACSPGARARRLSYRAVTPSGGGEQPALTLPLPRPPPSPPLPTPAGCLGGCRRRARALDPLLRPPSRAGSVPRGSATDLVPGEGAWLGWGPSHDGGGGSTEPPARARLRTALGWGDSQSSQEGTDRNEAHRPPQWGRICS